MTAQNSIRMCPPVVKVTNTIHNSRYKIRNLLYPSIIKMDLVRETSGPDKGETMTSSMRFKCLGFFLYGLGTR
jgi:hypothetical protein